MLTYEELIKRRGDDSPRKFSDLFDKLQACGYNLDEFLESTKEAIHEAKNQSQVECVLKELDFLVELLKRCITLVCEEKHKFSPKSDDEVS